MWISHRSCLIGNVRPGVEEVKGVDHIEVVQQRPFIELPNLKMGTNLNQKNFVMKSYEKHLHIIYNIYASHES